MADSFMEGLQFCNSKTREPNKSNNEEQKDPQSLKFDELVENLNQYYLNLNFTKLLLFLESNSCEVAFPFTSKYYEEFLKRIARDVNVLTAKSLDDNFRDVCNKIMSTVHSNKSVYFLNCVCEQRKDLSTVIMYKKIYLSREPITNCMVTTSRWVKIQPNSETSMLVPTIKKSNPNDTITNDLKIHWLNTSLAFVKNNDIPRIEFPNLNLEQARFIQTLLTSVVSYAPFDINVGVKELNRALWEAVKIYSLKYDFKVDILPSRNATMSLVFSKVPKQNLVPTNLVPHHQQLQVSENVQVDKKVERVNKIKIFVESLPPTFVTEALNKIINYLSDEQECSIIFTPNNEKEKRFYKDAVIWSRQNKTREAFNENYRLLFEKIESLLQNTTCKVYGKQSARRKKAGILEVKYKKIPKFPPLFKIPKTVKSNKVNYQKQDNESSDGSTDRSASTSISNKDFKMDFNYQNIVTSDSSTSTGVSACKKAKIVKKQTAKQPCANKNKNIKNISVDGKCLSKKAKKKLKKEQKNQRKLQFKERLAASHAVNTNASSNNANETGVFKPVDKQTAIEPETDDTDSEMSIWIDCTPQSREVQSLDRGTVYRQYELIQKTPAQVLSHLRDLTPQRRRPTKRTKYVRRRAHSINRKEQLIEALSVPVQADKAMKMMIDMGWSGGALGTRGDGITEPLMPALDIKKGRGLGHGKRKSARNNLMAYKNKEDTEIENVTRKQKTVSRKRVVSKPRVNKPQMKRVLSNPKIIISPVLTKSESEWISGKISDDPENSPIDTDVIVEKTKALLQDNYSFKILMETQNTKILTQNFRLKLLMGFLEFLSSDKESIVLIFDTKIKKSHLNFLNTSTHSLGNRERISLPQTEQLYADAVLSKYKELPGIKIEGSAINSTEILLKKVRINTQEQTIRDLDTSISQITEENMEAFMESQKSTCMNKKSFYDLQFRLLILLKILFFLKSEEDDTEVVFDEKLMLKKRQHIDNVIQDVNMRYHFGTSLSERRITLEIMKHVKDIEVGVMFNHEYTAFTLTKFFRKTLPTIYTKATPEVNTFDNPENLASDVKFNDKETNINDDNVNKKATGIAFRNKEFRRRDIEDGETTEEKTETTYYFLISSQTTYINKMATDIKRNDVLVMEGSGLVDDNDNIQVMKNKNEIVNQEKITENIKIIDIKEDCSNKEKIIDYTENSQKETLRDDTGEVFHDTETVAAKKDTDIDKIYEDNLEKYHIIARTGHINDNTSNLVVDNNDGIHKIIQSEDKIIFISDDEEICANVTDEMINEIMSNTEDMVTKHSSYNEDDTDIEEELMNERTDDGQLFNDNIESEPNNVINNEPIKEMSIEEAMGDMFRSSESTQGDETLNDMSLDDTSLMEIVDDDDDKIKESETNCVVLNKDIDLSDKECDKEQSLAVSEVEASNVEHKKEVTYETGVDSRTSEVNKVYSGIKIVHLVPIKYPNDNLTKERAKEIQKLISSAVVESKELPLLMCHGLQNGALIYTCHNEKSFHWLLKTISVASDIKVLDVKDAHKMAITFYCLFEFDVKYLFDMIELYNKDLSTKEWVVEKSEIHEDFSIFLVRMDEYSINYIHNSGLALFVGVDKVEFSVVWD